jgi:Double zinc ribbon
VIDPYVLVAVAVILGVVVVAILLFSLQRLKARRTRLLQDLASTPRLASDRAFNRLEMARREAAILGRQGTDTGHARELIAQSQAAFDQAQYSRSYELAQSAHEAMVHARQTGALPSSPSPAGPAAAPPSRTSSAAPRSGPSGPSAVASTGGTGTGPVSKLAPNRAESQFQIHLLDSELDATRSSRGSPSAIATAGAFRSQAQAAFDREQYTDALRFALKGRRELGGKLETLAPVAGGTPSAGPTGESDANGNDPAAAAERAAGGSRCAQCGYPARTDDSFCRGCGLPRTPTTCAKCGAARTPDDTFCGRCGARFS